MAILSTSGEVAKQVKLEDYNYSFIEIQAEDADTAMKMYYKIKKDFSDRFLSDAKAMLLEEISGIEDSIIGVQGNESTYGGVLTLILDTYPNLNKGKNTYLDTKGIGMFKLIKSEYRDFFMFTDFLRETSAKLKGCLINELYNIVNSRKKPTEICQNMDVAIFDNCYSTAPAPKGFFKFEKDKNFFKFKKGGLLYSNNHLINVFIVKNDDTRRMMEVKKYKDSDIDDGPSVYVVLSRDEIHKYLGITPTQLNNYTVFDENFMGIDEIDAVYIESDSWSISNDQASLKIYYRDQDRKIREIHSFKSFPVAIISLADKLSKVFHSREYIRLANNNGSDSGVLYIKKDTLVENIRLLPDGSLEILNNTRLKFQSNSFKVISDVLKASLGKDEYISMMLLLNIGEN